MGAGSDSSQVGLGLGQNVWGCVGHRPTLPIPEQSEEFSTQQAPALYKVAEGRGLIRTVLMTGEGRCYLDLQMGVVAV
jgi:hypothetical protein